MEQVEVTQIFGWLVGVGLNFGLKWRKIWVREELRWVHLPKTVENLTKMAEATNKISSAPSLGKDHICANTTVSNNGAVKVLSGSRLQG